MTDSKYHMAEAAISAKMAECYGLLGWLGHAQFWTKICICHLALAFYRLSFECSECAQYR